MKYKHTSSCFLWYYSDYKYRISFSIFFNKNSTFLSYIRRILLRFSFIRIRMMRAVITPLWFFDGVRIAFPQATEAGSPKWIYFIRSVCCHRCIFHYFPSWWQSCLRLWVFLLYSHLVVLISFCSSWPKLIIFIFQPFPYFGVFPSLNFNYPTHFFRLWSIFSCCIMRFPSFDFMHSVDERIFWRVIFLSISTLSMMLILSLHTFRWAAPLLLAWICL